MTSANVESVSPAATLSVQLFAVPGVCIQFVCVRCHILTDVSFPGAATLGAKFLILNGSGK